MQPTKVTPASFSLNALYLACTMALPALVVPVTAGAQSLEEVIVTARRREETLQDIPVTVTAIGEQEIERGSILDLRDVGRLVPNMQIYSAGSGSGSAIYLRGVGSSTISAAFDPAVALNVDGVVLSASRMIVAGQMDMRQIEVLKGPQSLYFGKAATAGVVSLLTNDPGDEFELMLRGGVQPEHDGTLYHGFVSGPIGDKFGARLALSGYNQDEYRENIFPQDPVEIPGVGSFSASDDYRGRESNDARLTLTWDATENFSAKAKMYYGEYEDDGPSGNANVTCPEAQMQQTSTIFVWEPAFSNCDVDETLAIPDISEVFLPDPGFRTAGDWNNGKPYTDQETTLVSLQLDWVLSENLDLTSISAYLNLENDTLEVYDYAWGNGGSHAFNGYEMWSQEFRLETSFDGAVNFSAGVYYADIEQEFITGQNAVNAGLIFPDPATGNRYDWDKEHYTDTTSWSGFGAVYWDITDDLTLTAGARYSDDDKDGSIVIAYMHGFLQDALGFLPAGTVIDDGLEFDDNEWTPEVSLNWSVRDNVNLFVAYKTGYKSGGFDNSALPSATLGSGDVSPLIYQSETGEGVEGGVKSTLLDGSLRLNATAFYYVYDDLQVQLFDSVNIQFDTFNAGELTTQGAEADFLWLPGVEGLTLRGALAYTDAEYTDEFINNEGDDLDGETPARTADWAGNLGFTWETPIFEDWMLGLSGDARYSDEWPLADVIGTESQDSVWQYDASVRLYSSDNKYELAVIGRNLSDEVVAYSNQSRPFACGSSATAGVCVDPPLSNANLDQVATSSTGLQYTVQFTYRY
jgi:iron complex outermembrane receptor protein